MQKSVIYFKRTLPEKVIQLLVSISNDAFNNREGKIVGNRESTYCLSYGGDESMYGCLQLGMLELEDNIDFLSVYVIGSGLMKNIRRRITVYGE